ncbi:flagellar biosynthesis protein FlhF [Salipaludibacillus agaradhaerens]|uniref:Flagellar biosynthesis protein FlhF n=1 Tax=Salipaludibacillus agaradhaerens TaxID=76935 RepID=A0A9Q4FWA0_SALAG|nr:flagellar biosynthesis protein FlhF [Salipaludibacillus agaradhaerens]MCR6096060.1 flagellar biosynthesis protein FlhF [Salipaludibacillus agaradhaerens]MCR6114381.1 flagellar biosynthesis protein FlhF [Salipaludibacillus agaradhaerens]
MKVKKFVAKDMTEAMTKVKAELGQDAVILNSKKVESGGFLGFFTKKNIEVIAALDMEARSGRRRHSAREKPKPPINRQVTEQEQVKLSKEIDELKAMIKGIGPSVGQSSEDYPDVLNTFNTYLKDQEVHDTYRLTVMKHLLKKWYQEDGESQSEETINNWVTDELLTLLKDCHFGAFNYSKKYLNVVGPTGAGKTTTIAKIAAKAVLKDEKKVAFITTDTFRIAAIEQLKTYGKILNVPVEVVYSIKDFKEAVKKLSDYDFILVDSAGRNFRNPLYVEQLNQVIDFNEQMETHLVLAMTSKYRDMKKIVEQFKLIDIDKLIFSKLDETETIGAMINIMADYHLGASYFATGQNVPDDIEEATAINMVQQLLRS